MTKVRWYWECPICHARISRSDSESIDAHKLLHPENQLAFTADRGEIKK
jgi:hypothetical protein